MGREEGHAVFLDKLHNRMVHAYNMSFAVDRPYNHRHKGYELKYDDRCISLRLPANAVGRQMHFFDTVLEHFIMQVDK